MLQTKQLLTTITDTPPNIDWEEIVVLCKGHKSTVLVAQMPIEPPISIMSSVTSGMYPIRNSTVFKKD